MPICAASSTAMVAGTPRLIIATRSIGAAR
jgi:hypothetical protein